MEDDYFAYYGRDFISTTKKYKVVDVMLDEYVRKSVKKHEEIFLNEIHKVIESFRKENKKVIEKIKNGTNELKETVLYHKKFITKLIELNELKLPKE